MPISAKEFIEADDTNDAENPKNKTSCKICSEVYTVNGKVICPKCKTILILIKRSTRILHNMVDYLEEREDK